MLAIHIPCYCCSAKPAVENINLEHEPVLEKFCKTMVTESLGYFQNISCISYEILGFVIVLVNSIVNFICEYFFCFI